MVAEGGFLHLEEVAEGQGDDAGEDDGRVRGRPGPDAGDHDERRERATAHIVDVLRESIEADAA